MADIFVSYARQDKARVAPLVAALERKGWSVWWDPAIIPGQEFDSLIRREIEAAKVILVVWTPASVESRWVRGEARIGADKGALVPVRLDQARLPIDAMAIHTTDLDDWKEDTGSRAFQELLSALMAHLKDAAQAGRAAHRQISICVLPFSNMSNDAEQEYFSDGISEDIITDLSKVSALNVISRNSAFVFKGKHVDLPEVARQLKVTHVLEGSVRKSASRVRITAQLIDGATNNHIWAERYDRDLSDIFALQDEISEAIVKALKLKLLPEEKKAIEDRGTDNIEAYDLFMRARGLTNQLGQAQLQRATELFRKALQLDPHFVLALGGLNMALLNYRLYVPERRDEIEREMAANTARIVAIAPNDWRGMMARASAFINARDFVAAGELIEQAKAKIEQAKRSAPTQFSLVPLRAGLDDSVGRIEESIKDYQEFVRQDPLSFLPSIILQAQLHITGRYEEVQAEYERSRDLAGDRHFAEHLAFMRMWGRASPEAVAAQYRRSLEGAPAVMRALVFDPLEAALFDPPAARALLRRAFEDPRLRNSNAAPVASFAALFGDVDLALAAMKKTYLGGQVPLRGIWFPEFAEARKDPRFKQLVRDLGLYDYWKKSGKWGDFVRARGEDDFEILR